MKESPKNTCDFCNSMVVLSIPREKVAPWWERATCIIASPDGTHELFMPGEGFHEVYIKIDSCPVCGRKL